MSNQILVPSLGESVTEATVSKWLKQVGEKVDSDEPLVELETDKVNVEVPSPLNGTLASIRVKEGVTVEVGALLGTIKEGKSISTEIPKKEKELEHKKQQLHKILLNGMKFAVLICRKSILPNDLGGPGAAPPAVTPYRARTYVNSKFL